MAQLSWNPLDKLGQIKKFEKLMSEAISRDTDNLEIHFLRFCIEYHIPKWLGFSDNLYSDKDFIVTHADKIEELEFSSHFVKYIAYFLNETGLCSPEDEKVIRSQLALK